MAIRRFRDPFQYGLGIMQVGEWLGHSGADAQLQRRCLLPFQPKGDGVMMVNASTQTGDVGGLDVWRRWSGISTQPRCRAFGWPLFAS
jgi:hypothetical protein